MATHGPPTPPWGKPGVANGKDAFFARRTHGAASQGRNLYGSDSASGGQRVLVVKNRSLNVRRMSEATCLWIREAVDSKQTSGFRRCYGCSRHLSRRCSQRSRQGGV